MARWVSDTNAVPPIYHELKRGRKTIATVRRVQIPSRKGKRVQRFQVIRKWADIMGGAIGPVFTSLKAAKEFVEGRL